MTFPPRRIALIGVGGVGHAHLAAIAALARQEKVRLVAAADPAVGNLTGVKAALEAQGVHWYLRCEDLLSNEAKLDIVTIAAPIPYHEEMTLACIRKDLYVNLEKPPVPLLHQLEALIEEDKKNRVSVGFQMIASEPVQHLKRLVVEGRLGEIREIRAGGCWPRTNAYYERAAWAGRMSLRGKPVFDGPATNALAHVIHNIMFVAAREPDGYEYPVSVQGELYRARPIQSYDVACLRGELRSGAVFAAAFAHATERELPFRLEIHGSKGWAKLSANGTRLETDRGELFIGTDTFSEGIERYYHRVIEFATGVRKRADTSLSDARGYLAATNGMLLSSGGVHEIGESWVTVYSEGNNGGFMVKGLYEAIDAFLDSGKLFSEASLPWAVHTNPVGAEHIDFVQCKRLLDLEDTAG